MRISRDQGALDAPMLSQSINQARRGSHTRHGPPVYLRKEGRGERNARESHSIAILLHSITSSARPSSNAGTSRPIAFAVPTLITSSNLVGCITGRSAGLVPMRILPV